MHHHLDKLAGVRVCADVDAEIARENHAIHAIELAIDQRLVVPPRCAFCSAPAMDTCVRCERPMCEDDCGIGVPDLCIECFEETVLS